MHTPLCAPIDKGWTAILRNLTSSQPELGPDITSLQVIADTSQQDKVHIEVTDLHDERWRVPPHLYSTGKHLAPTELGGPCQAASDLMHLCGVVCRYCHMQC